MGGIEKALISGAHPKMIKAMISEVIRGEIIKGCSPDISSYPVSLEPTFFPIWSIKTGERPDAGNYFKPEMKIDEQDLLRVQIWISPEQKFDWRRSEIFLKQLQSLFLRPVLKLSAIIRGS